MKTKTTALNSAVPFVCLALLALIFFYPVLLQGKTFYGFDNLLRFYPWASPAADYRAHNTLLTDPVNVFYPYFHSVKECLRTGILPLWNPLTFSGIPTGPPSHPLQFLSYLCLPLTAAHDLLLGLHLLGAGFFMLLYLREIGLRQTAALTGAVAWMFNGYVMVWFEFELTNMIAGTLAPTLYFFERWIKTKNTASFFGLICSGALSIASGYAHLIIYQGLFVSAYILFRFFSLKRMVGPSARLNLKKIILQSLIVLIGVCTSTYVVLGNLYAVSEGSSTQRREFDVTELYRHTGQLPKEYLATLIFPDFFGNPVQRLTFIPKVTATQTYNNYNELCIYGGIVPLFLMLASAAGLRRRTFVRFYMLAASTTLLMAMGTVLYYPLARYVPGLNLSTPTRIVYIFGFCFAVLAALGCDILLSAAGRKKWLLAALLCLPATAAAALFLYMQTEPGLAWAAEFIEPDRLELYRPRLPGWFDASSPSMAKPLVLIAAAFSLLLGVLFGAHKHVRPVCIVLLLAVLTFDLMSFGLSYNSAVPRNLEYPTTDAIRFLQNDRSLYRVITQGKFLHNGLAPFGIQDAGGYASFYFKRYGEYLHLSQHGLMRPAPETPERWVYFSRFDSPLLDLLNVKYVLTPPGAAAPHQKYTLVYDDEIRIYENTRVRPRAFFVDNHIVCDSPQKTYWKLGVSGEQLRSRVLLESTPPPAFAAAAGSDAPSNASVTITSYAPSRIELEVVASRKGFVVLSDLYHKGWRATLDGAPAGIMQANYIMRAVPVPEGSHRIVLTFHSKLLLPICSSALGWLGLFTALVFAGCASAWRLRNRPGAPPKKHRQEPA
ncbi:YfhO family protein [Thermodesulfobacteriota bacterium]